MDDEEAEEEKGQEEGGKRSQENVKDRCCVMMCARKPASGVDVYCERWIQDTIERIV